MTSEVKPAPRRWVLAALAFTVAVGLVAWRRLRAAARPCTWLTKEDRDAITRLEGEGGLVGLPQDSAGY